MKTTPLLLLTALTLTLTPLARAADAEAKGKAKGPDGGPGRAGMQKAMEDLGLSDEQKEKFRAAMQELREVPAEERRDKMTAKMKELLTKEQFEKWEKARAAGPGGAPGAGGAGSMRERMQKIMEELGLSDEQKPKVQALMQEQGQAMQGLRDASPDERREKMQKAQETMSAKMKEILNKEQFEKWEKARSELVGARPGGPGAGDAAPKKKRPDAK